MRNPDPLIEPEPVNISGAAMNPEPWKNPDQSESLSEVLRMFYA
jgi:hypothetical protein